MIYAYIATNRATGNVVAGLTVAPNLETITQVLARWFPISEYVVEVS